MLSVVPLLWINDALELKECCPFYEWNSSISCCSGHDHRPDSEDFPVSCKLQLPQLQRKTGVFRGIVGLMYSSIFSYYFVYKDTGIGRDNRGSCVTWLLSSLCVVTELIWRGYFVQKCTSQERKLMFHMQNGNYFVGWKIEMVGAGSAYSLCDSFNSA